MSGPPLRLLLRFLEEMVPMPDDRKEFDERVMNLLLRTVPPARLLQMLLEEMRLGRIAEEKRLEGLPPEDRRRRLTSNWCVAGLTLEQQDALLQRLREPGQPTPE